MSFTPIQLDKERNLRFGMRSISVLEKKLKRPMSKVDFEEMTMDELATIMWSGLVHEDKDLTPDKVMDLIDEYSNMGDAIKLMGEAFKNSFGKQDDAIVGVVNGEEPKNVQRLTSSRSKKR